MKKSVLVVDYGFGNLSSIIYRLEKLGYKAWGTSNSKLVANADLVILPGVGAFGAAMDFLEQSNFSSQIKEHVGNGKPLLGICLGMQLLTKGSLECVSARGLGLLPGKFVPFSCHNAHTGWNTVTFSKDLDISDSLNSCEYYFNHSFRYKGPDKIKLGQVKHGNQFAAAIGRKKIIGVQFHPEKSQQDGAKFLQNILKNMINA
ncbi:imidazole glycerol phosphate synthase subunit HisH [Candidatus Puniceispirillum sp.]|nr:imidazole glycerol phosphate synthase subunit HisH [Candidatus Puniceispirillum sp.]